MDRLGRALCHRQPDLKTSISRTGSHLNIAAVLFHNPLHGIEAKSGALSHAFGGEERLENPRQEFRRYTWAIIGDLHHDTVVLAVSAYPQFAFSAHCVDRVVDEIGPDLVEFAAER